MHPMDLRRCEKIYKEFLPSLVVVHNSIQYYCSNLLAFNQVIIDLSLGESNDYEHLKFNLYDWYGTQDQLFSLMEECKRATATHDRQYGSLGWYIIWSSTELTHKVFSSTGGNVCE